MHSISGIVDKESIRIEIANGKMDLLNTPCGVTNRKLDKERVGTGLYRLNLVSKYATQRADHLDTKFTLPHLDCTLYMSIFQLVTTPSAYSKSRKIQMNQKSGPETFRI